MYGNVLRVSASHSDLLFLLSLHKRDECEDLTQSRTCKEDLWQAQWGNSVSRGARSNDPSSPDAETDLTAAAFCQPLPTLRLHIDERNIYSRYGKENFIKILAHFATLHDMFLIAVSSFSKRLGLARLHPIYHRPKQKQVVGIEGAQRLEGSKGAIPARLS